MRREPCEDDNRKLIANVMVQDHARKEADSWYNSIGTDNEGSEE
jgi:hypothetical protein